MGLGGFLAGLSQASNKLPEAIQNRMLLQNQATERQAEAERRTQQNELNQQNAIITRLGITSGAGSVDATQLYGQQLSPQNMPLLTAFMGKAEDTRKQINFDDDKQRFEFDQQKLEAKRSQFTPWISAGANQLQRENRDTGEMEFREGVKPPPENEKIYLEYGKILRSDGSTIDIDPELVALFQERGSLMNPVFAYDKQGGLLIMKNGEQRKLEPDIVEYLDARLQFVQDIKFKGFMEQQDYRHQKKVQFLHIQTGLGRETDELKHKRILLKEQNDYAKDLFKQSISSLENKRSTPEKVLENATQAMLSFQLPPEEIDRYIDLWKPSFNQYKYNFKLESDAQKDLRDGTSIQLHSERIHQLLKDPEVQKRVGQLTGQVTDIRTRIRGGKGIPQAFIDFQLELDQLVDIVKRSRTGAAAKGSEDTFYNDMLGTNARNWEYLQGKMAAIIGYENRSAFSIYSTEWRLAYERQMTPQEEAQLRADLLFRSDVIVSSVEVTDQQLQGLLPQ